MTETNKKIDIPLEKADASVAVGSCALELKNLILDVAERMTSI
jgi:hypothetical protein